MSERSLVVVSAGLSQPSSTRLLADRLSSAAVRALGGMELDVDPEVIELREHARDLVNNLLTGFAPPKLQAVVDAVIRADGLIAVTPIFNASYSGLFKLFFDVIEQDALGGTPTLIGATGGTARHTLALEHAVRPLFAYLGAAVVPTTVYAATGDWGQADTPADASLPQRIERAAGELARAMAARPPRDVTDAFEPPLSHAEMLGASLPGAVSSRTRSSSTSG